LTISKLTGEVVDNDPKSHIIAISNKGDLAMYRHEPVDNLLRASAIVDVHSLRDEQMYTVLSRNGKWVSSVTKVPYTFNVNAKEQHYFAPTDYGDCGATVKTTQQLVAGIHVAGGGENNGNYFVPFTMGVVGWMLSQLAEF